MGAVNENNVPVLRFNEFIDKWATSKLEEVADFTKGKGISESDIDKDGHIECIRYGELYTHYNEIVNNVLSKTNLPYSELVISEANDVIIPASGESQLDIATASCVINKGVALGGDLNIIKSKLNGVFLSFYLNNKRKKDIAKLAQGVSVVHLYSSQLKTLKLNFPSLPEQQKIAAFLTSVDDKIQQLTKKKALLEEYKKGVMQQLFSGKLRFKDEDGKDYPDWEEKRLGEFCTFFKGKGLPKSEIVDDGKYKCIHYGELFLKYNEVIKDIISRTSISEKRFLSLSNDILMPTSDVTPNGLATASCLNEDNVILGGDVLIIRQKQKILDGVYFAYHISNNKKEIMRLVSGSTVYHLYGSDMKTLLINLPTIKEQQKIASYLSAIDSKIEAVNNQISQTQSFKKGLLQQMFV